MSLGFRWQTATAGCGDVLVFLGWPIGIALCALYRFFSPLTALIGLDELSKVLLKGACLGRQHAQNVCNGKRLC